MTIKITMCKLTDEAYKDLVAHFSDVESCEVSRSGENITVSATGTIDQCIFVAAVCDLFNASFN